MKKILTFIPLGIGISAMIIYLLNVFNYRIINNPIAMSQILYNLRVYLYVSIGGFILYFIIKVILSFSINKDKAKEISETDYEPFEIEEKKVNTDALKKVKEKTIIKEIVLTGNKYCSCCGEKIFDTDAYCKNCGSYQKDKKSGINPLLRNIINIIEIVVLILILYFSIVMLFYYKESKDPNFKSPFNISMTKE